MSRTLDRTLVQKLRRSLLRWYRRSQRRFLWREDHPHPYIVLVSECMLQQTQAARVAQLLAVFLKKFPDIHHLARASNTDMILAWRGLGYNSRALRLRDCARAIVVNHQGSMPSDLHELLALPGIGPYTARAILSFAFHQDIEVIDVNVKRVYSRLFSRLVRNEAVLSDTRIEAISKQVYPKGNSSQWHQAVMDIGAAFCTARSPDCTGCPLSLHCCSANLIRNVPKTKKVEPTHRSVPHRIWRGKIIELLRNSPAYQQPKVTLANLVFEQGTREDKEFLNLTLLKLERDNLIEQQGKIVRLRK